MVKRSTLAATDTDLATPPRAPSWLLGLFELPRALSEAGTLIPASYLLRQLPQGDGHAVMTLPGFLASGQSMRVMRNFLRDWGYDARSWRCGRNYGVNSADDIDPRLDERLALLAEQSGGPVSLIGWSLGGLIARELARRHPERVRSVILLGSPIGDPKATNAWRLYQAVNDLRVDDAWIHDRVRGLRDPIDGVPMTAIYSHSDAVVSADIARLPSGDRVENIGVLGSHFGMGFNPAVLYAIADRLLQSPGDWQPFRIAGLRSLFFH